MKTRIISWKGFDILASSDGRAMVFMSKNGFAREPFQSLKDAFSWINKKVDPPMSIWDMIKDAVKELRLAVHWHDDSTDFGINMNAVIELHREGLYDFLKERYCLHLVYPSSYEHGIKDELDSGFSEGKTDASCVQREAVNA
jgi:hypothetical protein